MAMTADRKSSVLVAIVWLFVLHGLADVTVGIYRCRNMDPVLTDLLAAALPRSQLCLLSIWLAVGTERLSWRISGLAAGACFLFSVFSRWLFPDGHLTWAGAHWVEEEWLHYFRLSGPGDLLVKAPILGGGIAVPLLVRRAWRAVPDAGQAGGWLWSKARPQFRFQYGFREVAIWTTAVCLCLIAGYQTSPHAGWTEQLLHGWRQRYRLSDAASLYTTTSAVIYVGVALGSLWAVYSKASLGWRALVWFALAVGPAWGFQIWLHRIVESIPAASPDRFWAQASAETLTSLVAAVTITGSLLLVRLYASTQRSR